MDFGYAFAPPHRMTVARPEASEKTLLDLEADDLRNTPLAIFKTPRTGWHITMRPLLDGKPFLLNTWSRGEEFLPILNSNYFEPAGSVQLEVIGGVTAALTRVKVHNSDSVAHQFSVACEALDGWVMHNPAWIESGKDPDTLVACQAERPDRFLLLGIGAAKFPADRSTMTLEWALQPGEIETAGLFAPTPL